MADKTGYLRWARLFFCYVIVGVLVGLGVAALFLSLKLSSSFFLEFLGGYSFPSPENEPHFFAFSPLAGRPSLFLLAMMPAIGGLMCGLIKFRLFPVEKLWLHDETDVFIDGFHNAGGVIKARTGLVRGICSVLTIGSGGSAGKEGPSAVVGAAIGSMLSRLFRLDEGERRKLMAAAGGAGIAAIFRSPLGGAFFGVETLYKRDIETETLVPAMICSITAYTVSCAIFGAEHLHAVGEYGRAALLEPLPIFLSIAVGIACVPFVILFVKLLDKAGSFFRRLRIPGYLKPGVGGLLLGCLFLSGYLLTGDEIGVASGLFGGGDGFIQLAFYGELTLTVLAFTAVAKIVGTSLTLGSGGSGCLFEPSLTIGAALGGAMGQVFGPLSGVSPWVFSLIGATAFFGSAANAPLAALFIVCEISGSYTLFVPALFAIIPAYILSGRITIYPEQYETRKESPAHRREFMVSLLGGIRVDDVCTKDVVVIRGGMTVREAICFVAETEHMIYPVVDEEGKLAGIITAMDLAKQRGGSKRIDEICTKEVMAAYPDEYIEDVMRRMDACHIGRMPVVRRGDDKEIIGMISRSDIMRELCHMG